MSTTERIEEVSNSQQHQPDQTNLEVPPPSEAIEVKAEHLNYLKKGVNLLLKQKDEEKYLLMLEKLIYLTMQYLGKSTKKQLSFDPSEEIITYVEKVNKKAVETFKEGKYQESAKVVSSVVELLNQKEIVKIYENPQKYYESKILAYNNLSCVYNAMKKYGLSAKVISFTLQLEEELAAARYGQSELSIISTYFNYSAILSQAKQHDKTIPALQKGFTYMEKVENRKGLDESEVVHLKNLRISGLFMMGKEYEVNGNIDKAKASLDKAMAIAKELKKQNIIEKVEQALANLKKKDTS